MEARLTTLRNRNEWLKARRDRIGGSEAAAIVGRNPYMSNIDLWRIKTGRQQADDISEKEFVKYGTNAETHLRALFALDYPQYKVTYIDNNMWINDKYPFSARKTAERGYFFIIKRGLFIPYVSFHLEI